jgi:hypothetical protein
MAGPTVASIGANTHTALATNLTLTLPGSLVAGNIIVGFIYSAQNGLTFTWPAGWTEIDKFNTATANDLSCSWAWYRVVASNAAPNVSYVTSTSCQGQLVQVQSVSTSNPIGNFNKTNSDNGASSIFSGGSLSTAGVNSLVLDMEGSNSGTLATPAGYTAVAGPVNSLLLASIAMASPGTTPAISYDQANASAHDDFQVEILAGPIPHPISAGYFQGG